MLRVRRRGAALPPPGGKNENEVKPDFLQNDNPVENWLSPRIFVELKPLFFIAKVEDSFLPIQGSQSFVVRNGFDAKYTQS